MSESLAAFRRQARVVETSRPPDDTPETVAGLQQVLAINEASDQDIARVYFNHGVLTGDWDGPHISPIATYDRETRQVLIMDVDREWYVPYWAADTKLLEAMPRPARRAWPPRRRDRRSHMDQDCNIAMSLEGTQ